MGLGLCPAPAPVHALGLLVGRWPHFKEVWGGGGGSVNRDLLASPNSHDHSRGLWTRISRRLYRRITSAILPPLFGDLSPPRLVR